MATCIYNHLIEGTTSAEALAAKHAYERVTKASGVMIKAYHAYNLRFNDTNYKGSCLKAS